MSKRILSLLLSCLLLTGLFIPVMGAETDTATEAKEIRYTVVNTADLIVANQAGIPASNTHTRDAEMTLRWSGEDLKKTIPLTLKETDWSECSFLEFWLYSSNEASSTFGVTLIADNPETKPVDYYEASVAVSLKGWNQVSIGFKEFTKVNSPKGFNSIDCIELWPKGSSYSMSSNADLYIDAFTVTNQKSEVKVVDKDRVLYDFRTRDGIAKSGVSEHANRAFTKAPDKETMAFKFTDDISSGTIPDDVNMYPADPDMSGFNTVEIVVYSERATKDTVRIVFRSDNEAVAGNDYYYFDQGVDWEGWKTIQIPIDSFAKATGSELGWNQINRLCLWWFTGGTAEERLIKDSTLYIETIALRNIDPNERFLKPLMPDPIPSVPDEVDVASIIKENFPNNQHPRLLITQDRIDWIKENWKTDEFLSKALPGFLEVCNGYIGKSVEVTGTSSPTSASYAEALALAYKLTGDQKYADECWKRIEELTYKATTWANDSFALTIGDATRAIAITYDLMYNDWTEEQKVTLRNAMVMYAINTTKGLLLSKNGVQTDNTNWTPIGNSGLGMIALVLADEPGFENVTNAYINRLHISNSRFFRNFGTDGSGHEGPDYWSYAIGNYVKYEAALYNSLGGEKSELFNKFSMTDEWGLDQTADFITHIHGTKGTTFNYFDGSARGCHAPGNMWFAAFYNKPEQGGQSWESAAKTADSFYFYDPTVDYKSWRSVMPLDSIWDGGAVQAGTMRTSWEKGNQGFFVGYKGANKNMSTHDRLDTGTFVLESQGQRFIVQIDDAEYLLPGMFGTDRFRYYRNRAEGSNTLVIGPGVYQGNNLVDDPEYGNIQGKNVDHEDLVDQVYKNISPIVESHSENWGAYGIIDMTDAYRTTAAQAKRGYALLDGRNAFLLQDEIVVKEATDVYSFMYTEAKIEVAPDGQSAILTQNGKMMKATLQSNCRATLVDMAAEPFPTTPNVNHEDNTKWRKLTVKASVSGSATFSVLFTPYYGENQYTFAMDSIVPLKDWKTKLLAPPVTLTGIYLDGVMLSDFATNKMVYTLKEDSLGNISATAENGVVIDIKQAEALGFPAIITATKGSQKTVYVCNFSDERQKVLDGYTTYPVLGYFTNIGAQNVPQLYDGDLVKGWANDGSNWVTYDLGSPKKVFEVEMLWDYQDIRQELFTIEVSSDNKTWKKVWEGESILSKNMEKYTFPEVTAQYVKVHGISNPKSTWTSICELWVTSSGESFLDVDSNHWAASAINDMAKVALVQGVEPGKYYPEANLSRAAFLTMLSRVYGLQGEDYSGEVPGIAENAWYTPHVEAAYKQGLIPEAMLANGFLPNQNISREEIAALSVTFYEKFIRPIQGINLNKFDDKDAVSEWAKPYIEKALASRIVSGMTETTFEPQAGATRAQAATILKRIYIKAN